MKKVTAFIAAGVFAIALSFGYGYSSGWQDTAGNAYQPDNDAIYPPVS
ncbi:hypothetical protein MUN89_03765 [Halobacillus salinarum]|uniref:Uncharacterized protein n=1 Tax=Halobacillus salinarum TaxID=2932257 RepID=A0ABY4EKT7_9BACI|nr:hypothetical protein [Halobacillus salinarum]UOQ45081.1 hypothetical protein MUN89_03765 [Halobacillus salinarum]